jgi:hypothetical protein
MLPVTLDGPSSRLADSWRLRLVLMLALLLALALMLMLMLPVPARHHPPA